MSRSQVQINGAVGSGGEVVWQNTSPKTECYFAVGDDSPADQGLIASFLSLFFSFLIFLFNVFIWIKVKKKKSQIINLMCKRNRVRFPSGSCSVCRTLRPDKGFVPGSPHHHQGPSWVLSVRFVWSILVHKWVFSCFLIENRHYRSVIDSRRFIWCEFTLLCVYFNNLVTHPGCNPASADSSGRFSRSPGNSNRFRKWMDAPVMVEKINYCHNLSTKWRGEDGETKFNAVTLSHETGKRH